MNEDTLLYRTPLYKKHLAANGRMVPFAGWEMPVQYTGIIEEHLHTREKASIFDICHMGEFHVKGPKAAEDLDKIITCDVKGLKIGTARYGFILDRAGGVIDDMIVFKIEEDHFMVVVNASTIEKDKKWIMSHVSGSSAFMDESENTGKIDVQGPLAPGVIAALFGKEELKGLKRFNFTDVDWQGTSVLVSATGYTGEKGYELFISAAKAGALWDALLAVPEVKPAGLGARDSLRLEMGYSLYGHEINDTCTPFEARLMRFVNMNKWFIGKDVLIGRQEAGVKRVLAGFVCEGRRAARDKFRCFVNGKEAGIVTSGVFSPCLKVGIGMCYIDKEFASVGTKIELTDGKVAIAATIQDPPFVKK